MRPARRRATSLVGVFILVAITLTSCGTARNVPAYHWDFSAIPSAMPALLSGMRMTALLTAASIGPSMLVGAVAAAMRLSNWWPVRVVATAYVEFMRSTPVLVQLVWVYYCLPILLGVNLDSFTAVVVALSAAMGAYYAEAFRAGMQSVPKEIVEAADVIGLSYFSRFRYVIFPHALRSTLPVLMSTTVGLIKDTSLVSALGVADLMYQGDELSSLTYRPLETLTTVALLYFVMIYPLSKLSNWLESRLNHDQHARRQTPKLGWKRHGGRSDPPAASEYDQAQIQISFTTTATNGDDIR